MLRRTLLISLTSEKFFLRIPCHNALIGDMLNTYVGILLKADFISCSRVLMSLSSIIDKIHRSAHMFTAIGVAGRNSSASSKLLAPFVSLSRAQDIAFPNRENALL